MTNSQTLPSHWLFVALAEVSEIVGGGTPSRHRDEYFGGDIPWATPSDVTASKDLWLSNTSEYITDLGLQESSAKLLPTGAVLMTSRATVGATAIAARPMATNQGFASFICDGDVLSNEYLAFYLPAIKDRLLQLSGGTTFKEISKSTLAKLRIPLPPLPEQERIVEILRRADEVRQLRISTLQQVGKLYTRIFSYQFGTGEVNNQYTETVKLKDLLAVPITSGYSPKANNEPPGIPVFTLGALTDTVLDGTQIKYLSEQTYSGKGDDLEIDDLLISRSNTIELVGRVSRYRGEPSPVIYPDLTIRIRLLDKNDSPYVEAYLRSPFMKAQIQRLARGTSSSMKKISQGDINEFDILWPPHNMRAVFSKAIRQVDRLWDDKKQSLETIDNLQRSLLSRAFSGKLTSVWSTAHAQELAEAVTQRDRLLGIRRSEARSLADLDFSDESGRTEFESALQNNVENIARSVSSYPRLMDRLRAGAAQLERNQAAEQQRDSLIQLTESIAQPQFDAFAQQVAAIQENYRSMMNSSIRRAVAALNEPMRQAIADLGSPFVRAALDELTKTVQTAAKAIPPETLALLKAIAEQSALLELAPSEDDPRYPLLSVLSEEQYEVYLSALQTDSYFTPPMLAESADLDPVLTTNTLDLLVETGLLHRVQVGTYPDNKTYVPVTVYRQFGGEWDLMQENDIRELNQLLETADS